MTDFTWKIKKVDANADGLIVSANYFVVGKSGDVVVETEGNWFFQEPSKTVPFENVTEEMVASWVKEQAVIDGKSMIEQRLSEQIDAVKKQTVTVAPWLPQTFTPEL